MNNLIEKKCGFISIIGRPNVGKSTLMNHLIGQKVSITSRKPQTTQKKINGIITTHDCQYIFVDTPGFQTKYINKFNNLLNQSVISTLNEVDVVVWVVEAGIFNGADEAILKLLPKNKTIFLVINKKDQLKDKMVLQSYVNKLLSIHQFQDIFTVSAKHNLGLTDLLNNIKETLPQSEFLYDNEQLTDKNSKFLASEIIREKLFRYLGEELPYSVAVEINEFIENNKIFKISATIIVAKDNQKGIVIGKGGEKLKKISTEARIDMEKLFGIQVFLEIWVKVRHGFLDDAKFLSQFES